MIVDTFIFPADMLNPSKVDEHFAPEAEAAAALGFGVALLDDESLRQGDVEKAVAKIPAGAGDAFYRGWMLSSAEYASLVGALSSRDVSMLTDSAQYERAHELPGWYDSLKEVTPRSVWATKSETDEQLLKQLPGATIVKDYVKSAKHDWDKACYIPDTADTEQALTVIANFRALRREHLVGGIVLREFEAFVGPELRTWWVDSQCKLTTPHPDTPYAKAGEEDLEAALARITSAVAALKTRFVTIDFARNEKGEWRLVELGDGQVSDRPETLSPSLFLGMFS